MSALLLRDLRLALRSGGGFGLSLVFFLVIITLVPFGLGAAPERLAPIAPGLLWVAALLACLLSLDRFVALDWEDGSLELLLTAPIPAEMVVLVKALAHWLTTGLPLACAAPLLGVLLFLPAQAAPWLFVSLLVGTPALSMIGGFGACLTVGVKRGGLLLSLLVLPLYVPILIFGAETAKRGALGLDPMTPLLVLAGLVAAIIALMPFAAAAVLRINIK